MYKKIQNNVFYHEDEGSSFIYWIYPAEEDENYIEGQYIAVSIPIDDVLKVKKEIEPYVDADAFFDRLLSMEFVLGNVERVNPGTANYELFDRIYKKNERRSLNDYSVFYVCYLAERETDENKVSALIDGLAAGECKGIKGAIAYRIADFAKEAGLV